MNCSTCRHDAFARSEWGCEKESIKPIARMECLACGIRPRKECDECRGTGETMLYRCPNQTVPRIYFEVISSIVMIDRGLGLPAAGGTGDQAAWFIQAYRYVQPMFDEARKPKG